MQGTQPQEGRTCDVVVEESLPMQIPVLRVALWIFVSCISLITILPSLYLVTWAFWGTDTVGILANSPSFKWLKLLLLSSDWQLSLVYSFVLAAAVSSLSCALLVVHFYFMRYATVSLERISYALAFIPVILPAVIYALALRIFGSTLGLTEIALLSMGHMVLVIPIQYFIFETAQDRIPDVMLFAGSVMGASPFRNLWTVYIPMLRRPIMASFSVGFFFSFDEIVIAAFVIDSSFVTVPKRLWDDVNRAMNPSPAVVATILLIVCVLLILGFSFVGSSARKWAAGQNGKGGS